MSRTSTERRHSLPHRFLALCLLLAAGCDKIYEAEIVAHLPTTTPPAAVEEQLLSDFKSRFGLYCEPPEVGSSPTTSPAPSETHRSCSTADYTDLEITTVGRDITLKIHKLSGFSEPPTFHGIRARAVEMLKQVAPGATITVAAED